MTKTKKYYIVDDDTDDQIFLKEALMANDNSATFGTAYDGLEALSYLKKAPNPLPDAIFLDLNMPGMNGKQCLAELKRTPFLRNIPVIIYSTTSEKKEIQETIQLGASYFLIKKSSFKELCEELSSIIAILPLPL